MQLSNIVNMINVIVSGARGRMGSLASSLIEKTEGFNLAARYGPNSTNEKGFTSVITDLPKSDLIIDFCPADSILDNCKYWIESYKNIIVGASGLLEDDRVNLSNFLDEDQLLWIVPNFSIGAVLQKKWAIEASKYYKDVGIVERHHTGKQDTPSGTSYDLAISLENISSDLSKGSIPVESEDNILLDWDTTIVNDIEIRSYRNDKYLAEHQVYLSSPYESFLIDHSSSNREAFTNGIKLAINKYNELSGLCVGLELVI